MLLHEGMTINYCPYKYILVLVIYSTIIFYCNNNNNNQKLFK